MPKIIESVFDEYAGDYSEKFNRNPIGWHQRRRIYQSLRSFLPEGTTVLDVGCGPGSDFRYFYESKLTVEALDISAEMVRLAVVQAEELGLHAQIRQSNFIDFQPPRKYDVVWMNFGVINLFPDIMLVSEKIRQCLAPDGIAVVVSMPSIHAFSLLGLLGRGEFRSLGKRLVKRSAALENGLTFYYRRRHDWRRSFKVIRAINLGWLLPTPDQYRTSPWARRWFRFFRGLDSRWAGTVPDIFGGDHICYILKPKSEAVLAEEMAGPF